MMARQQPVGVQTPPPVFHQGPFLHPLDITRQQQAGMADSDHQDTGRIVTLEGHGNSRRQELEYQATGPAPGLSRNTGQARQGLHWIAAIAQSLHIHSGYDRMLTCTVVQIGVTHYERIERAPSLHAAARVISRALRYWAPRAVLRLYRTKAPANPLVSGLRCPALHRIQ